jgi:hypothetical protein
MSSRASRLIRLEIVDFLGLMSQETNGVDTLTSSVLDPNGNANVVAHENHNKDPGEFHFPSRTLVVKATN